MCKIRIVGMGGETYWTVTAKTTSGYIPGDQPEERIDGYGGKDFEKIQIQIYSP